MTSQCATQLWFLMDSQHICQLLFRQTKIMMHAYLPSGPKKCVSEISFIPLNKLAPIMEIKMGSYNCRGFNVSKLPEIKELLNDCDVLLNQETGLLPHEFKVFSKYLIGYNCYGVSGMKCTTILYFLYIYYNVLIFPVTTT